VWVVSVRCETTALARLTDYISYISLVDPQAKGDSGTYTAEGVSTTGTLERNTGVHSLDLALPPFDVYPFFLLIINSSMVCPSLEPIRHVTTTVVTGHSP
jgi:hypothetical protein